MPLQEEAFFKTYTGTYTGITDIAIKNAIAAQQAEPQLVQTARTAAAGMADIAKRASELVTADVKENIAMRQEMKQVVPAPIQEIARQQNVTIPAAQTGLTGQQYDAIAGINALLSSYGIGELGSAITDAVQKGYTSDTIQLIMQDPNSKDPLAVAFQERFPANKIRLAAGKSVLSAAEYLKAERTYAEVFQSYGMGSMANRSNFNKFITNDVSAAEVSDRVALAVNKVQNADAATKKALSEFYPMLNQSDIVSAMLNPEESLPALQRKIQISEIGGAAMAQGLNLGTKEEDVAMYRKSAEELASLGITKEQARAGFANVAEITPRAEFLSSISQGADYGQKQAEQEQFQGLASAKRAREALVATEQARFAGASGLARGGLSTGGSTSTANAGQF